MAATESPLRRIQTPSRATSLSFLRPCLTSSTPPPMIDADDGALLTAVRSGSELHRALFLSPRPLVRGFLLRNQFERISPIGTSTNSISSCEIEDCHTRYNGDADHHQRRKKFTFPARLICGDCYEVRLDKVLQDDAPFDVCSYQFALHYSWSTEARARRAQANVSALLRPGGTFIGTMPDANVIIKKLREAERMVFGNSVYWIQFDDEFSEKKFKSSSPFGIKYKFHLEDAVDCPEWIVPFDVFKSLAEEYDLELVFAKNSHEFVHEYMKKPDFVELMRRLGALGDGNQDMSTLSPDEWEVAYLYLAFVLKKRGQPDRTRVNGRKDRGQMHISKEDIMSISSGD